MRRSLPLRDHTRLLLDDRDEAEALTRELWEPHTGTPQEGKFHIQWNQFDLLRSTIGAFEFGSRSLVRAQPKTSVYRVCFQIEGSMEHRIAGKEFVSRIGNALVHPPRQDLTLRLRPQRALFAAFEESVVSAALRSRTRCERALCGQTEIQTDQGPGRALLSFFGWLANEIDTQSAYLIKSPKSLAAIDHTLTELFADALVSDDGGPATGKLNHVAEFRLRQIEDWIAAHIGEPFGLTELADAAGVDVRSLRNAFRTYRDTTPTEYVINARLDRARSLLIGAKPDTTITSVCIACGMFHFGRFSARYKARFGETPTQTLSKSGRR